MADEIMLQMEQVQSGVGWYDSDIQDVFDELSKSFPMLKDPDVGEPYRQLFTVIAGVMSNGMKAKQNVEFAGMNFANFLNTGSFSPNNPYTGIGWNQRSNIMGPQIAMLNSMIRDARFAPRPGSNNPEVERLENFLKFMFSEHSVRDINKFRAEHGTKSPAKIGKLDDRRLGMYAFGPKFGPFILNLNGMSDETVDSWASRSFYRHMGRSFDPLAGKLNDAPRGPAHREAMKRALRDIGASTNLSSRDIQAVLWFYEKELYNHLGKKIPLEVFSDGAREFTRKYGAGTEGSVQQRTDRERTVSGAVESAGARYDETPQRIERRSVRFSAAPIDPDEFRLWFRKSKVVNKDASPKVMYHGTSEKVIFKSFDTARSEFGTHFGTARQANEFVMAGEKDFRKGGRIIPVFLSIQNPLRLRDTGAWSNDRVASQLLDMGLISESLADRAFDSPESTEVRAALQDAIKAAGYDGVVYLNRAEGINKGSIRTIEDEGFDWQEMSDQQFKAFVPEAEDSYIIFDGRQAKSTLNEFRTGEGARLSFSAAPLPSILEQKNKALFAPAPKKSFKDMIFDFFLGEAPTETLLTTQYGQTKISALTRAALIGRTAAVDRNAMIEFLEKQENLLKTGDMSRLTADYSPLVALLNKDRASQLFAAAMLRGNIAVNKLKTGDILSATLKVEDSPDNLMKVFELMLQPGPPDPATNEPRDKREIFRLYATAMRAIGLKADGKRVPKEMDDNFIKTTISFTEQNYPEIVEAYKMYQRFNRSLLKAAVDAELITPESFANLTKNMDYYGYYYEVFEEVYAPGMPKKVAGRFNLRPYKGTELGGLANDPMQVMLQNSMFWTEAIAKNLAARKSFELARRMGVARLLNTGEDPDRGRGEEDQVMFFRDKGVDKRFAVSDPLLVSALGSDDRIDVGKFWEMIGLPTQVLRETITRDPGFMVANLMRDTLSAWITSGADIMPFIGTVKGFANAYKNGASFQALQGRGVVGSYDLAMLGPADLAKRIRSATKPKGVTNITSPDALIGVVGSLWNRLGAVSEMSDAATRIAVYESAIKQGFSEAEAAFRALEIMNFSRRGASQTLSILTKLVPFLNARIQGMDVLYQAGKGAVKLVTGKQQGQRDADLGKKFLIRGGMLAAISVALEMLNDDDEDYQQLDDYIKNSNVLIPLAGFGLKGQFIAVPKPFEAGLLFSTFPQQFYKSMTGQASTRENAALFFSSFASTFGVNPIPQFMLPPLEVIVNHDFYTGLPLISEGKARLAPELQYNSGTSSLAMMIGKVPISYNFTTGKFEGVSPIVIDNLISGYTGPFGTYIVQAASLAMEGVDAGPERLPRSVSQLPVVRRFFIDSEYKNPKVVSQAYELFRVVDEANRSYSRLRQIGDAEAVKDYLDENRDILSYKKYVFKLVDGLNKLNAQERRIESDQTMTRDEKFEAMAKLRETRMKLAAKVSEINAALGR